MSRVPADTVLVRLAIAAVIALPLSGCGGDDPETASAPSTPATTAPAASTPAVAGPTTPAAGEAKDKQDRAKADDQDSSSSSASDGIAASPPDTKETAQKASPVTQSNDDLAAQMKRAYDALKEAGLSPGKPLASGDESGALTIKDTTVVFFPSPQRAAAAAAQLTEAFKASPQKVTVDRKANRLFLMSLVTDPTPEQIENYKKVRQTVNGAV